MDANSRTLTQVNSETSSIEHGSAAGGFRAGYSGAWVWDVNRGLPVYWSAELSRIHGRDPAQGLPSIEEYRRLHRPEDWSAWIDAVQKATRDRSDFELRSHLVWPDGSIQHIRIAGQPVGDTYGVSQIIGCTTIIPEDGGTVKQAAQPTNTDIEDRKRAEEELRESELQLRLMVDSIPALVCTMNAQGELETANRQVVDYLGKTVPELREWKQMGIIHDEDLARVIAKWTYSLESGEPFDSEHRSRRADGVFRWFHVRGLPLRDDQDRICRWYVLLTDIEDRKRAEEESKRMEGSLREVERRLSSAMRVATVAELSASIAHEINQPLAAVLAHGDACQAWLSKDPPNVHKAQTALEKIIRDAKSAADVITRIRALFKQAPPVKVALSVNAIVLEVLNLLEPEIRRNGVAARTDLAADPAMVLADKVQIQQALLNLVHNAVDSMDEVNDGAKALVLSSRRDGVEIVISVRDRGCGIPDPWLIFDPFYTTKETGMGMGLAICRSIINAHGGRIWATLNEDGGTTFTFALPVLKRPLAALLDRESSVRSDP